MARHVAVPVHHGAHTSGAYDTFASTDVIEPLVKRLRETSGPTGLDLGAIADGTFLKRSGLTIVGGTAAPLREFRFQPGGTADGINVFTSWSSLVAATAGLTLPVVVVIDDTYDPAPTVPSGTWTFPDGTQIRGNKVPGPDLTIADGGVLVGVTIFGPDCNFYSNSSGAVLAVPAGTSLQLHNNTIINATTSPFFTMSSSGSFTLFGNAELQNDGVVALALGTTGAPSIFLHEASGIGTDAISGTGAFATVSVTFYSIGASFGAQPSLSSTPTKTYDYSLSDAFDAKFGSTRGALLYRGSGGWAKLDPVASGRVLTDNGAGADPTWSSLSASQITSGLLAVARGGTAAATANANEVFAGPSSGGAAAPSFRSLVAGDIPSLDAAKITSGLLSTARGGTGVDSSAATTSQVLAGNGSGLALTSLSTLIDNAIGSTRGAILYRGASGWAKLDPVASGRVLTDNGAGADPTWTAPSAGATPTLTQVLAAGNTTSGRTIVLSSISDVIQGVDSTSGGDLKIRGGNASSGGSAGGAVAIVGGDGAGGGAGGALNANGGLPGSTGTGGDAVFRGGLGGGTSGSGGGGFFRGGDAQASGDGGACDVRGGHGVGANKNAGGLTLSSGNSSGTGTGSIILKVARVGASGSSANTAATVLTVSGGGAPTGGGSPANTGDVFAFAAGTSSTTAGPLNFLTGTWTWNNANSTFTGLKLAITQTAYNAASMQLQILGGASATTEYLSLSDYVLTIGKTAGSNPKIRLGASTMGLIESATSDGAIIMSVGSTEALRVLHTAVSIGYGNNSSSATSRMLNVVGANAINMRLAQYANNTTPGPYLFFEANRGTPGTNSAIQSGDTIADIRFMGWGANSGDGQFRAARLRVVAAATFSNSISPGRMVFGTSVNTAAQADNVVDRWCMTDPGHWQATRDLWLAWVSSTTDPSGTPVCTLSRSADGVLRVGTSAANSDGSILARKLITAKTTAYTVTAAETRTVFTNSGASGSVTFTLPTAAAGLTYTFMSSAAQTIVLDAPGTDLIYLAGSASTAGGTLTSPSAAIGYAVTIVCDGTRWIVTASTGTWTLA